MSRAQLVEHLRGDGDRRSRTTSCRRPASVAARALAGKRVLALTMPGILDDLDGLAAVGMNVDAVLIGGADEGEETGRDLLVPEPQPRVPRARGGRRALLPAQEPLVADGRRCRVSMPARSSPGSSSPPTPRRRCSASRARQYFAAALEALDAEAGLDMDGRRRPRRRHRRRAAARHATVLVRTGKFRPDEVERSRVQPDGIVSSIAQLPDWLEQNA